jgi:peptidoglycan/LPS O-acetylase OafA/YrhL
MCYSLYLVQAPIVNVIRGLLVWFGVDVAHLSPLVTLPLCFVPTIWIAWQFHRLVERRFMRTDTARRVQEMELLAAV